MMEVVGYCDFASAKDTYPQAPRAKRVGNRLLWATSRPCNDECFWIFDNLVFTNHGFFWQGCQHRFRFWLCLWLPHFPRRLRHYHRFSQAKS